MALPRINRPRNDPWWAKKLEESCGRGEFICLQLLLERCDVAVCAPYILHEIGGGEWPTSQGFRPESERVVKAALLLDAGARLDVRNEWFKDDRGMRLGAPGSYTSHAIGISHNFNSVLQIRPEIGYYRNWNNPVFDLGTKNGIFDMRGIFPNLGRFTRSAVMLLMTKNAAAAETVGFQPMTARVRVRPNARRSRFPLHSRWVLG